MSAVLHPTTLDELVEAVRSSPRAIPVGGQTKPRLSQVDATRISTRQLSGLVEYDPAEFTFTARAGTPLREIQAALEREGQSLPFDPPFAAAGATLGGTVAAGLSGPGRFRFGGVRDFILGVRFVDGSGRLLRLGGKVVKNAAGFDVPKFLVGSLGRFGVLAEITFKVFPRPESTRTVKIRTGSWERSLELLPRLATSRVEPAAIELPPGGREVLVRLAGPAAALPALATDLLRGLDGEVSPDSESVWDELRDWDWAYPEGTWVRIPVSGRSLSTGRILPSAAERKEGSVPGPSPQPSPFLPGSEGRGSPFTPFRTPPGDPSPRFLLPALLDILRGIPQSRVQISSAGEVANVSLPSPDAARRLADNLTGTPLRGLTLRGEGPLWLGCPERPAIESAVKHALDPDHRFPDLFD